MNQVKEDISYRVFRQKIPEAWVLHEYGPDYGIDCVVELFDYVDDKKEVAETLGETFFVQLKSSDSIERLTRRAYSRGNVAKGPLKENRSEYIDIEVLKFQLEVPELLTVQAMGQAVPVVLVLVDVQTERAFFICLNDYIDKILVPEDPEFLSKDSKVIYVPVMNEIRPNNVSLVPLRAFGKRAKMYGAFGKFAYQRNEIAWARSRAASMPEGRFEEDMEMLRTFTNAALRQDVWQAHEFWEPMGWGLRDLTAVQRHLNEGIPQEQWADFLGHCTDYVWHRLCNLANMYEELVREWFLPTVLAQLSSYPDSPSIQKVVPVDNEDKKS